MHYLVTRAKRRLKRHKRSSLIAAILALLILLILILLRGNTQPKVMDDRDLVERVARHVLLPDEIPTVATVSDVTLLVDQPFFANAQNGDKVLLFRDSNKAVLYDPESDRVLDIGNIESAGSEASPE